jgi:2,3-bisphosphoglycerate-dependent phosphoglycerate mutase
MQLVLVRHAKPDTVGPDDPCDPQLSRTGASQAQATAKVLRRHGVDAIYSSPTRRAMETAEPLALKLRLPVETVPALREFNAGSGEYVDVDELRRRNDPRWQALQRGELYDCPVTADELRRTIVEAVDVIVARHPGATAVLFTHAGVVNLYLGHLLGIGRPVWTAPGHAAISRVLADRGGRRMVASLNETAHLPVDGARVV